MARIKFTHNSFSMGVVSRDIQGNVGVEGYNNALSSAENFQIRATGGLFKRPGTHFVSKTGYFNKLMSNRVGNSPSKLIAFHYSEIGTVVLEIGVIPLVSSDYKMGSVFERKTSFINIYNMNGCLLQKSMKINLVQEDIDNLYCFQSGRVLYFLMKDGIASLEAEISSDNTVTFIWCASVSFNMMPLTFMNKEPLIARVQNINEQGKVIKLKKEKNKEISPESKRIGANNAKVQVRLMAPNDELPDRKYASAFCSRDKSDPLSGDRYISLTYPYSESGEEEIFYLKIENVVPDVDGRKEDGFPLFNKLICTINKSKSFIQEKGMLKDTWLSMAIEKSSSSEPGQIEVYSDVLLWRISAFNDGTRGYPKACCVFDGRLFFSNAPNEPLGIWGSSTFYNDWFNFTLGPNSGDAIQAKGGDQGVFKISWITSHSKLFVGTSNGIYVGGSVMYTDEALTPKNFDGLRLFSSIGASELQPLRSLDAVFFVDNMGVSLYEIIMMDKALYSVNDLSLLSKDVTRSGIVDHCWQQSLKTYWAALGDGRLATLTYLKNNNIVAWSNQKIGGYNAKVISVVNAPYGGIDYVWMVVQRQNPQTGVFWYDIEYLMPSLDNASDIWEGHYTDGGMHFHCKRQIVNVEAAITYFCRIASFSRIEFSNVDYQYGILAPINDKSGLWFSAFDGDPHFVRIKPRKVGLWNEIKVCTECVWEIDWSAEYPELDPIYHFSAPIKNAKTFDFNNAADEAHDACAILFLLSGSVIKAEKNLIYLKDFYNLNENYKFIVAFSGTNIKSREDGLDYERSRVNFYKIVPIAGVSGAYELFSLDDARINIFDAAAGQYSRVYSMFEYVTVTAGESSKIKIISKNEEEEEVNNPYCPQDMLDDNQLKDKQVYIDGLGAKFNGRWCEVSSLKDSVFFGSRCLELELFDLDASPKNIDGTYIYKAPLQIFGSVEVTEKSFLFKGFSSLTIPHLGGKEVTALLDGRHFFSEKLVFATGKIEFKRVCFCVSIGYPIEAHAQTVPFYGGSMLGSSEGAVSSQRSVALRLFRAMGGRYGASPEKTYEIPYEVSVRAGSGNFLEPTTALVKAPMSGLKTDNNSDACFYIEHSDPTPFAVLNVTRDIDISDA